MTQPVLIQQLLASDKVWEMPEKANPKNDEWALAWAKASEFQKRNLARGWLWNATEYVGSNASQALFQSFFQYLDQGLDWVQTIQPYLDSSFFENKKNDEDWQIMAQLLLDVHLPELENVRLQHDFFFGDKTKQEAALLQICQDHKTNTDLCPGASVKQAWRIVENDTGDLYAAAKVLSIFAGMRGAFPHENLPAHAKLYQTFGYHIKRGTSLRHPAGIQTPAELRSVIQHHDPVEAAQMLSLALDAHLYVGKDSGTYLRSDSFLVSGLKTDDPFEVMKQWIPQRAKVFDHAITLGMSVHDACAIIAGEKKEELNVSLPHSVAVDVI